ncbi:MAG: hypothetical protein A4E57_00746 [Syntrophorhabdaceae bacterium PtaU1.Bin034]|jgi:hypothetical protein|nr:MAG: hypothetical protein A4E57_00746 [Syntrophorhabdaceae bacterium PtaU1.Bin034]
MVGRKKVLILFAVMLVAFFLSIGCTVRNSPRHSLSELRTALLNHDADAALRYLDVDSIVDCLVRDIFLKYESGSDDPLQAFGIKAGREATKLMMPGIKGLIRHQVRQAITSDDQFGYFDYIRRASVWYLNVTVEGDTAMVEPKGKSDIKFRMARTQEGNWKIVEIITKK